MPSTKTRVKAAKSSKVTNVRQRRAKRYVFTCNNYVDEPTLTPPCSYLLYGKEVGDSGTPHLQGYMEFSVPVSIQDIHLLPGLQRAHLDIARGSFQDNYNYCTKEGDYTELGNPSPGAGRRTDFERIRDLIISKPNRAVLRDIADMFPAQFVRNYKGICNLLDIYYRPPEFPLKVILRPWQQLLFDEFMTNAIPPRKIIFYVDIKGNSGKTFFCQYWHSLHTDSSIILSNAKHDRIYAAYTGQTLVFYDLTRTLDVDTVPYATMEHIKDGYTPPGMYGVPPRVYDIPIVVVMMNSYPNMAAFSQDRYDVRELNT